MSLTIAAPWASAAYTLSGMSRRTRRRPFVPLLDLSRALQCVHEDLILTMVVQHHSDAQRTGAESFVPVRVCTAGTAVSYVTVSAAAINLL